MQAFFDAIKTLASGRVYPLVAPQDATYPLLVYTCVADEKFWGVDNYQGIARIRVQVDAYAETYAAANALQAQVQAALVANLGRIVDVRLVLTDFEEETRLYRVAVDYTYHR